MRLALLLFFMLPILEITGFVVVGGYLGVTGTIGLTILSGLLGMLILRTQGLGTLRRLNTERLSALEAGREIVDGLMIAIAGLLLIIPGFVTDCIGLLLLLPPVRHAAWGLAKRRFVVVRAGSAGFQPPPGNREPPTRDDGDGPIIDLDEDQYRRRGEPSSGRRNPDTREIDNDPRG
ncbi:FxsA family protein [Rhizobium halophytocola]|uniref:UPF0716 protein FxsA n=1 Tax=Rhizobium halophytocola TaxID=735519 RepID=A0ABS4E1N0_9HYPH|nr:FxsA family protein [Rhizobium halophytocola]MBP1851844.1 UPF0716 protein FxsA [Rhizobium halophytocola]